MPRMTKKLAEDLLKAVKPVNRKVTYLNHGGCGVAAVALGKLLVSMGFKNVHIWSMETYDSETSKGYHPTNLEYIRDAKKRNGIPRSVETYHHYMVRVGDWFFDSENAVKKKKLSEYITIIEDDDETNCFPIGAYDIEDIEFTNRFQFLWNRTYNREQNPIVEIHFDKIKKKFACTTP